MNPIQGYKTYIAAIGLVALAIYNASVGDIPSAVQNVLAALAAFGLHSAIVNNPAAVTPATPAPAIVAK